MSKLFEFKGRHVMADLFGVDPFVLNDVESLSKALERAARKGGAAVLTTSHHSFYPSGLTILLLLSESHVSLHTYPESGHAFFDAFTCGDHCNPENILEALLDTVQAKKLRRSCFDRGMA